MTPSDSRTECSFGASCYRRNPHHFKEYKHNHLAVLLAKFPDLNLPSESSNQLKEQIKIYSDIEHGYNSAVVASAPRVATLNTVVNNTSDKTELKNVRNSRRPPRRSEGKGRQKWGD